MVQSQMRMNQFDRKRLKALMRERGWDAHETSRQIGLVGVVFTPWQLLKIISGERVHPRGDVLAALCKVMDVQVGEFYDLP